MLYFLSYESMVTFLQDSHIVQKTKPPYHCFIYKVMKEYFLYHNCKMWLINLSMAWQASTLLLGKLCFTILLSQKTGVFTKYEKLNLKKLLSVTRDCVEKVVPNYLCLILVFNQTQ